jgi:uncharacterized membrane protein YkvA (DUF1232 family)
LSNLGYENILERARDKIRDHDELRSILLQSAEKLVKISDGSQQSMALMERIKLLIRMLLSHIQGAYTSFSPLTLVLLTFGVLYFLVPTDVIPDVLPALGLTDDLSVAVLVSKRISGDIERYRQWEQSRISQ